MENPKNKHFDVIVVGGGPVGATLANLLGIYGQSVLVLEKEKEIYVTPRAVAIDDESLRIWQMCGLIDQILPHIVMGQNGQTVFTYRTAQGKEFFQLQQTEEPFGYAKGAVFIQPLVHEILLKGLRRFSSVYLLKGHTVQQVKQGRGKVTVSGIQNGHSFNYTASYVIGCDGGQSIVRKILKIPMQGFSYQHPWVVVDIVKKNRKEKSLVEGVNVWCDPDRPTVMIPLPHGYCRWEFMLKKGEKEDLFLKDQKILSLIHQRRSQAVKKVVRKLIYTFKALIAKQIQKGPIFLAGDAAHVTPPFAGQGLASGLRDVANLAWKLNDVLKRKAPSSLLKSYSSERYPHQKQMIRLAVRLGYLMMPRARWIAFLQVLIIRAIVGIPFLRHRFSLRGPDIQPIYQVQKKHRLSQAGRYMIQPILKQGHKTIRFDDLLGTGWAILSFDQPAKKLMSASESQKWKKRGVRFIQLSSNISLRWAEEPLQKWLGKYHRRYLVIRPDRFIEDDVITSSSSSWKPVFPTHWWR